MPLNDIRHKPLSNERGNLNIQKQNTNLIHLRKTLQKQ